MQTYDTALSALTEDVSNSIIPWPVVDRFLGRRLSQVNLDRCLHCDHRDSEHKLTSSHITFRLSSHNSDS